ncbi:hypothetical protein GF406_27250 [candidate division KSB1 bacterium]|nr:hypothetical protein [candidate division KSB1 bacterium]
MSLGKTKNLCQRCSSRGNIALFASLLAIIIPLFSSNLSAREHSSRSHGMTLSSAAKKWEHAMPTGNGQIGALVFGDIENETVILTHDALFIRSEKPELPNVSEHLPKMRDMIAAGQYEKARLFFKQKIDQNYDYQGPDSFHPAFNITVDMENTGKIKNEVRGVNFETGEVTVGWSQDNIDFERKLFVSRKDNVIVMGIKASKPGALTCQIGILPTGLKREELGDGNNVRVPRFPSNPYKPKIELTQVPITFDIYANNREMSLEAYYDVGGSYNMVGGEYGGFAQITVKGGSYETHDLQLNVYEADEILLLCRLYANKKSEPALKSAKDKLNALAKDYDTLLNRHTALHRELYLRTSLYLDGDDRFRKMSNEELVDQVEKGKGQNAMFERLFDFGRYALICSSRPGSMPANLQGIWNGEYAPAWASDYHNDINIQMAYFQALPGNIAETVLPYFDFYESQMADFRTNAQHIFGCRGILVPISHTTHGLMYKATFTSWTAAAGWLAQLYYDYWLFTGDREFLEKRAIPFMKKVALFYQDFVLTDNEGKILFAPSHSPENSPSNVNSHSVVNATMDIAVAKELLNNLCHSCEMLGIEGENIKKWRQILKRLPGYEINSDGALKEWTHPALKDNYNHRHMSHLYPLFPGYEIMPETHPELVKACSIAVNERMRTPGTAPAWSFPLMACIYARLGDGNSALNALKRIVPDYVMPNLFMLMEKQRPIMQFDATSGVAAAILETLVFSTPDMIKLLPAIPKDWQKGKIQGVKTRSGIEVDVMWDLQNSKLETVFLSPHDCKVILKFPKPVEAISMNSTKAKISNSLLGESFRVLYLSAKEKVALSADLNNILDKGRTKPRVK